SRGQVCCGRLRVAARGLVFGTIGFFLIRAALHYDASEAKGLAEALRTMASSSSPRWLLGAVAVGLVSYGLYELFEARYRRIWAFCGDGPRGDRPQRPAVPAGRRAGPRVRALGARRLLHRVRADLRD